MSTPATSLEFCFKHQTLREGGQPCAQCAEATSQADALAELADLRRRTGELERTTQILDRKCARLFSLIDAAEEQIQLLLSHVRPNEDLLP